MFQIDYGMDFYPFWDGDNQEYEDDIPDGWYYGFSDNCYNEDVYIKIHPVGVELEHYRDGCTSWVGQDIPIEPDTFYEVEGELVVDGECEFNEDCFAAIVTHGLNDNHNILWGSSSNSGSEHVNSQNWTHVKFDVKTGINDEYLGIYCYHSPNSGGEGEIGCNNFSVKEILPPIPIPYKPSEELMYLPDDPRRSKDRNFLENILDVIVSLFKPID